LELLAQRELRCLRSGGRVISLGTYNYRGVSIAPSSDAFDLVTEKIIELYEVNGQRISAGSFVPSMLSNQGATVVSLEELSSVARPGQDLWEWYRQFSFSMLPRLIDASLITSAAAASYRAVWEERSRLESPRNARNFVLFVASDRVDAKAQARPFDVAAPKVLADTSNNGAVRTKSFWRVGSVGTTAVNFSV
jgi:hypothetical protein